MVKNLPEILFICLSLRFCSSPPVIHSYKSNLLKMSIRPHSWAYIHQFLFVLGGGDYPQHDAPASLWNLTLTPEHPPRCSLTLRPVHRPTFLTSGITLSSSVQRTLHTLSSLCGMPPLQQPLRPGQFLLDPSDSERPFPGKTRAIPTPHPPSLQSSFWSLVFL